MNRQDYTVADFLDLENPAQLLTDINRIIKANQKYVNQVALAKKYYDNENGFEEVTEKRVNELIADVESNPLRRADNKVPFNYHQILTDQKAAYLFGEMVLLKSMDKAGLDTSGFDEELMTFSKDLHRILGILSVEASNAGHGWAYAYIDQDSKFKVASLDAEEIIPVYDTTIEHRLMYVIRHYTSGKSKIIEWYAPTTMMQWKDNKLSDAGPLFMTGEDAGAWDHLPFVEFNNTPRKTDDLHKYKALIDVYDKTVSLYANDIEDMQQLIFVLVNYGGTELGEFLEDLKKYKAVNMDASGKLETLKVEIPVEARMKLLELLDRSIWMSGQGVDPRMENMGNLSGTALKQLYGLLELKASQMESEFRDGITKLVDLYKNYLNITKKGDYSEVEVDQIYTRSMISNELELITMAQNSKDVISDETIIANHPWVEDVAQELDRLAKQKEENMKAAQEGFGLAGEGVKAEPTEPDDPVKDPKEGDDE